MQVTKKQHFIQRAYLRAWSINDKIFCLMNRNKILKADLMKVGLENYFYEMKSLSKKEEEFLLEIATHVYQNGDLIKILKNSIFAANALTTLNTENSIERKLLKHGFERLYSNFESKGTPYFENLLKYDSSFFYQDDKKDRDYFLYCLAIKYFRTKKIKNMLIDKFEKSFQEFHVEIENIRVHLTQLNSYKLAVDIIQSNEFNLILLKNMSQHNFITGDQPVINVKGENTCTVFNLEQLELFCPLSPKLAILISKDKTQEICIDNNMAINYNKMIFDASEQQVYAQTQEELKSLVSKE